MTIQQIYRENVREGNLTSGSIDVQYHWNYFLEELDARSKKVFSRIRDEQIDKQAEFNKSMALRWFKTFSRDVLTSEEIRSLLGANIAKWEERSEQVEEEIRQRGSTGLFY